MKIQKVYIGYVCLILLIASCYNEEVILDSSPNVNLELPLLLNFDGKACAFDARYNLLRFPISKGGIAEYSPTIEFNKNTAVTFEGKELKNREKNLLGAVEVNKSYRLVFTTDKKEFELELVFTNLPVVQIVCDSEVRDEPKTLSRIVYNDPKADKQFSSLSGIEYRGKYSRSYPKKSFGFSLWEDGLSDKEFDYNISGTGSNSDWILNGAVIDPSRIRNVVSFEIWKEMGKTMPGSDHWGIESKRSELFLNNEFRGLYLFSENLNHFRLSAEEGAVLYKAIDWADGATRFESFEEEISTNQYWNGWEQKYPFRKEVINWEPLNKLYVLVVNAGDDEFVEHIGEMIDIPLFVDYFILLNLTSAADNTGKNTFLFKKSSQEKFQIIPWDLDGSWGILYDGSRVDDQNILSNNLYARLMDLNADNFRQQLKARWAFLRENCLSEGDLKKFFDGYFHFFQSSDIVQMENQVWNIQLDMNEEQEYINEWIESRLLYLDDFFSSLN